MKIYFTCTILLLLTISGFSQSSTIKLRDDLFADKSTIFSKFIPLNNGELTYGACLLDPKTFIYQINQFKADASRKIKNKKNESLIKKDIDYFTRNIVEYYVSHYGRDSLVMATIQQINAEKRSDPNYASLIKEASKKLQIKILSTAEAKFLNEFVLGAADLNDTELFKHSVAYRDWIDSYLYNLNIDRQFRYSSSEYESRYLLPLEAIYNKIPPGFIKNHLTYQYTLFALKMVTNPQKLDSLYGDFARRRENSEYKADIDQVYNNLILSRPNSLAPDFSYYDVNDKLVRLNELRGKYVYIDIWATWCAPCKVEIPFLSRLESDYSTKNIIFLSLSVDNSSDKAKWVSYVKNNKLGGIQVIADKDFNSDFIRKFSVASIPRFILIDPVGQIVFSNAARPSDPDLRNHLDHLLK
ncbi:TlpA family protein disulfide reductase [Pedobacter hiemivivus]|nr:TlpA disulfide reductase family protein [Pedobacter hiemivivus]